MLALRALFVVLLAGSALIPFACSVEPTFVQCMDVADCGSAGECFTWKCEKGSCIQENMQEQTLCEGGKKCNGRGSCVTCLEAADCPSSDMPCYNPTCNSAGECKLAPAPSGSVPSDPQKPGDCMTITCDGSGHAVPMPDSKDTDDENICTMDSCDQNGMPVHMPTNEGMFCNANDCTKCNLGVCLLVCTVDQICTGNNLCGPKL